MIEAPDTAIPCTLRPAANCGERHGGAPIDTIVLHYTGMPDDGEALARLTSAASGVSCHYLVLRDGAIVQMVPETLRAWHAGVSCWRGHKDINSRSIGVEIANPGHEHGYVPFQERQVESVIELCRDICSRHAIEPRNIVAHSDIAPMRKTDPGEFFPWRRLHVAGLGHYVEPEPVSGGRFMQEGDQGEPVAALQEMLEIFGYGIDRTGVYDASTSATVAAFQRHFRPGRVDGIADRSTISTLKKALDSL